MSGPNYHAWTHLPKAQGGTDPLEIAGGAPIVFRAAVQAVPEGDDGTTRTHYLSGNGGDNVYWDYWDASYDTTVFDISHHDFTDSFTGRPSIAGVALKQAGLYSIHAQIDIWPIFNGVCTLRSNYDQGQATFYEIANIGTPGDLFLDDLYGIRLDHWRYVEDADTTWPNDGTMGGSSTDVEIVFSQLNDSGVLVYGSVPAGVSLTTAAGTPGSDVWIPGGYNGGWGFVPYMVVAYWGIPPSGAESTWPDESLF